MALRSWASSTLLEDKQVSYPVLTVDHAVSCEGTCFRMSRWRKLAMQVWKEAEEDDIFGLSAQLSYYFLLAVFPFLLFLTTLLGFLAHTGTEIYDNLISYARQMLPYSAFQLVTDTLKQVQAGAGGGKLSVGILVTLWAAASGMSAMMDGLNRAYEVKETRPWWKTKLIALGLTIALSGFLIVATVLVLSGSRLAEFISGYFGFQTLFTATWKIAQWPVALLFLGIAFALLYRYAPSKRQKGWAHVFPGALVGMVLWLCVSLLFRLYLHFFNSYNATYGSLGAVIVLLLWFYLSGAAIIIGAEVNTEIAKQIR